MSSFTTKIKKLKRLRMDEISVRLAQQVAILSERSGLSRQANLPSDEQLISLLDPRLQSIPAFLLHLQFRTEPHFFASFNSKDETLAEFRRRWPNSAKEAIAAADRISEGRFDLLGVRDLKLGTEIDWHLEPISGKRTPLVHWSQLDFLDPQKAGDKKFTWEISRHQFFLTLGRAYWLTGDERYAKVFASHITSWMDHNPPKLGINWASSLEVAFRSISWLWALHFFEKSPALDSDLLVRMIKFLYLNASHLETYLSTYFSPNTHITGEALGLIYIGLWLPEFTDAARWLELGLKILVSQLSRQVQDDGVYFEQASYYSRYTADFYIHLLVLLRANSMRVPLELKPRLQLLLDHLMFISRPDGTTPFFGDDDGGRLVMLDNRPANDFRATLSTGAVLFNRPDYKFVAREAAEETLWLLGPQGLKEFDEIESQEPAKQSVEFPIGGYYVMRDGWSSTANYLLFDCGPHGMANCGHAHADLLAIELAVKGRTLLVDPATFTYTGAKEWRDWFRSSAAHNTLTVDRQSSSIPDGTFSWKTITSGERLGWIEQPRFTYVAGRHRGYERLGAPGTHTRNILFLKGNYWIVRDRVELTGAHDVDLWFHFASGTSPSIESDNFQQWIHENGAIIISFAANGSWRREDGWVSHCYGERVPAPVCAFSSRAEGDLEIITFLVPAALGRVEEIEVSGGRGFEVEAGNYRDLLIVKTDAEARTASLISDFEYTWLRFERNSAAPTELLLLGGHKFEFEGAKIADFSERVEYEFLPKD